MKKILSVFVTGAGTLVTASAAMAATLGDHAKHVAEKTAMPLGNSALTIAAVAGILLVIMGLIWLYQHHASPNQHPQGKAWVALIVGALLTVPTLIIDTGKDTLLTDSEQKVAVPWK